MSIFSSLKEAKVFVFNNLDIWCNSCFSEKYLLDETLTAQEILDKFLVYLLNKIKNPANYLFKDPVNWLETPTGVLTNVKDFLNYLLQDEEFKNFLLQYIEFIREIKYR